MTCGVAHDQGADLGREAGPTMGGYALSVVGKGLRRLALAAVLSGGIRGRASQILVAASEPDIIRSSCHNITAKRVDRMRNSKVVRRSTARKGLAGDLHDHVAHTC